MQIEWLSEYEIGYLEFDEQHKWLISLYNRIVSALDKPNNTSVVSKYMSSLSHYTVFHFGAEESMLQKKDYPDLDNHKKQHQEFIRKINSYNKSFGEGNHHAAHELLRFLKGWLINHIISEDKQYVEYMYANVS